MSHQEIIIDLYFDKKYKQTEIAKELNVSNAYITKIIKTDPRYINEKASRKSQNKVKNTVQTKEYIKQKRSINSIMDSYMKQQHIQASMELSGRHSISNRAYKNWNSSAYKYNDKTKTYNLKRNITTGFDVPKKIKWD